MPKKPEQAVKSEDVKTMEALIEIIVADSTPAHNEIQALNKLLSIRKKETSYFETMVDSRLSHGSCPSCGFETHWLVPEAELNIMGIVSSEEDDRVPMYTSAETCPEYAESCSKKKIGV